MRLIVLLACLAPLSAAAGVFDGTVPVERFAIACEGGRGITQHWELKDGRFEWFTTTSGERKALLRAFETTKAGAIERHDKYGTWDEMIVAHRGGWSLEEMDAELFRFQPDRRAGKVRVEIVHAYIDDEGFVTHAGSEFITRERCTFTM